VQICLVVDIEWSRTDRKYMAENVQPLQVEYAPDLWASVFASYTCETINLNLENQSEITCWLLKKLASFFRRGSNRRAFVDLTSAPREWDFSAFYVSNFFTDVEFYFVKAKREKTPSDYTIEERNDEGMLPEFVITSELRPPLANWLRPHKMLSGNRLENVQYEIFKLMYEIASRKKDLSTLRKITIDETELAAIGREKLHSYKNMEESDVLKSISKFITDIDRFKLFKRVRRKIEIYTTAIALMQALFEK